MDPKEYSLTRGSEARVNQEKKPVFQFQATGMVDMRHAYLRRAIEDNVTSALRAGRSCLLVAPRQVGKSNMVYHMGEALRREGKRVAIVDISALGASGSETEEEWCYSFSSMVEDALKSKVDYQKLWDAKSEHSDVEKLQAALRAFDAEDISRPLVLFVDEADVLLAFPFGEQILDALLNLERADANQKNVPTICFIGTRIGSSISNLKTASTSALETFKLDDFTRDELRPMESGLTGLGVSTETLMDAVFAWTNGHPSLTQLLCEQLVRQGEMPEQAESRVRSIVEKRFLYTKYRDAIIVDIEAYLLAGGDAARAEALACWGRLRTEGIRYDERSSTHEQMLTSGVAKLSGSTLIPRNAIFKNVFDQAWIEKVRGNPGEDAETVEDSLREKT